VRRRATTPFEQLLDKWLTTSHLSAEPNAPLFPTLRQASSPAALPPAHRQSNVDMMILHQPGESNALDFRQGGFGSLNCRPSMIAANDLARHSRLIDIDKLRFVRFQ